MAPIHMFQNVFMGVALDTYDEESGIHPRNKQLVSKRLAMAGLNVAYDMTSYPTNGPYPVAWNFARIGDDLIQVDILYDKAFMWNPVESEGFYVCCLDEERPDDPIGFCNSKLDAWQKVFFFHIVVIITREPKP